MKASFDRMVRRNLAASILLLLPVLAACTLSSNEEPRAAIDPPPSGVEQSMLDEADGAAQGVSLNKDQLTVYLMDRNGYLAPMTMGVELTDKSAAAMARQAIDWMTVDEERKDQLPEGFTAALPASLQVSGIQVDAPARVVTIDFAAPLPTMAAADERHLLESLVWTMTELPGIDRVKLTVAGQPLHTLPSSGQPVYDVLTRSIGINVEQAKGVAQNRSMAVTLYFSAQSEAGEGYFVPVTRVVARAPDRARAALEQLIQGPSDTKALKPVMSAEMTIEQLNQLADTVNVSLRDDAYKTSADVSADMLEALVLTMTETTGAPQVRVVMNGDDSFLDSKDRPYDQPVVRPTAINALKS